MISRKILVKTSSGNLVLSSSQEVLILFEASIIWPMLDSYYITLLFIVSLVKDKNIEAVMINKRVQWLGESLFYDKSIFFFESCNQESIKNAVSTFLE